MTDNTKALALADELYRYGSLNNPTDAADELRRLYDLLGKANALARIRLTKIEKDEALLRQALEALERNDYLGWQANLPVIKAIKERLG
jgi:hypothetical protein